MTWDFSVETKPVARKDYYCEGMDWICNVGLGDDEYEPQDLAEINTARSEGSKILKWQRYIKVVGKWEGEFCTFRCRPEINEICKKYELYRD